MTECCVMEDCIAPLRRVTVDYVWNIQHVGCLTTSQFQTWPTLESHSFPMKNLDYNFHLVLRDYGSGSAVSLELWSNMGDRNKNPVNVSIVILDETAREIELISSSSNLPNEHPTAKEIQILTRRLEKRTILDDYLRDDKSITFKCGIEYLWKDEHIPGLKSDKGACDQFFSDGNQFLPDQLKLLFESGMFNVTFDVDDRHFQAHKNILASRSKVFAAMFSHETKEKLSNNVKVEDIKPDVFQELLLFIYTGRVSSKTMDQMTMDLLAAADKYMLDELKIACEHHLMHKMSVENCVDLLSLTDQHHPASHLKSSAIDFFRRFPTEVMATDGWKRAKEDNLAWLWSVIETVYSKAK